MSLLITVTILTASDDNLQEKIIYIYMIILYILIILVLSYSLSKKVISIFFQDELKNSS